MIYKLRMARKGIKNLASFLLSSSIRREVRTKRAKVPTRKLEGGN